MNDCCSGSSISCISSTVSEEICTLMVSGIFVWILQLRSYHSHTLTLVFTSWSVHTERKRTWVKMKGELDWKRQKWLWQQFARVGTVIEWRALTGECFLHSCRGSSNYCSTRRSTGVEQNAKLCSRIRTHFSANCQKKRSTDYNVNDQFANWYNFCIKYVDSIHQKYGTLQ